MIIISSIYQKFLKTSLELYGWQFNMEEIPALFNNNFKCFRIQFGFGVGKFKYANKNFQGAKGVAIATKFTQESQKSTDFSSVRDTVKIFTYMIQFSGLWNSNILSEFFRQYIFQIWLPWRCHGNQIQTIISQHCTKLPARIAFSSQKRS